MTPIQAAASAAQSGARTVRRTIARHDWIERVARLGIATKGVIYLLIGGLAAAAALGVGGGATDSQGAFQTILQQPFGRALLAVVTVGLFIYAAWRFIEAFMDPDRCGSDLRGLANRCGMGATGILYIVFGVAAARLLLNGGGDADSEREAQDWTARVMAQPLGLWAIGLAGLGTVGFGLYQFYWAFAVPVHKELDLAGLSNRTERWIAKIGRFGFAAWGTVFIIMGGFLIVAAYTADPSQTRGLAGAMREMQQWAFGSVILGVVALGLIAYGVDMLIQAYFRRIEIEVDEPADPAGGRSAPAG